MKNTNQFERVKFQYNEDIPFEPKSIVEVEFLGSFSKTPSGDAGFNPMSFQVILDVAPNEMSKDEMKGAVVTHLEGLLDERGYEIERGEWVSFLWLTPKSFAHALCTIMRKNGFGYDEGVFDKAAASVEKALSAES